MTITNPTTVKNVLKKNGVLEDMKMGSIWQYENPMSSQINYALFPEGHMCDIYQSPFVQNPICLFEENELTEEGMEFIK